MVYVLLFPQLLLVIHAESRCNKYGCVTSFMIGLVLRILSKYRLEIKLSLSNDNYMNLLL
jgi:high affinity choline transporter 7